MREGSEYHCPDCGATSPVGTTCIDCRVLMIDENGNTPLKPVVPPPEEMTPREWLAAGSLVGTAGLAVGLAIGTVGAVVAGPFVAFGLAATGFLPRRFQTARRRRRARAFRKLAGETVRIADASPGVIRVQGKVKVLGKSSVGAYERDPRDRECWRFMVHDGSGLAVVDDDCFEIWSADLKKGGGTVGNGAQIEVVGRAGLRAAPEAELAGSLRDSMVLCFEGTPDTPLLLLV